MSGIHIVGDSGRFDTLLQKWANHNLQCVLHVKPEGSNGARLRQLLPNGFLVGRITNNTTLTDSAIQQAYEANPKAAAAWIWGIYQPTISAQPQYNAWQLNNEPVFGSGETRLFRIRRLCEFTREIIDLANAQGHGVALFNFARGTPELDEWVHFYEVWRYALSKNATLPAGRKNILSLHQYGAFGVRGAGALFHEEAWHIKRYEMQVRPHLPTDLKAAEYFINESGPDGGQDDIRGWIDVYGRNDAGRAALVTDWTKYNNDYLANQPGCKGAAFFTLGQEGGFGTFDIANDPVADMLASVQYRTMKPATTAPPQPQPTPPPPQEEINVNLAVPYVSQRGEGANESANDCGAAAVKSTVLINVAAAPPVDLLAREAAGIEGQPYPNYSGLQMTTLIELGRRYGAQFSRYKPLSWAAAQSRVRDSLKAKKPIIALVHYDNLPVANRLIKENGKVKGHYIVLMGATETEITYHDPYHDGTKGKGLKMSWSTLRAAWEANPQDNNPKYDMLVMQNPKWDAPPVPMPSWTQRDAAAASWFSEQMARALRGDAGAMDALIGAIQAEPKRQGLHDVIAQIALPPLYRERDKGAA